MSQSIELLKEALELEDILREKLESAKKAAIHADSREALNGMLNTKRENMEALHWLIMAESGKLELPTQPEPQIETGATRLAKGKCPFSAMELNKMGFNVTDEQLGRK